MKNNPLNTSPLNTNPWRAVKWLLWALRLVVAAILLQTLYFKFGGQPESIYIFSRVGLEPWGRYGSGLVELLASVLVLIPRTSWIGAVVGFGVMAGAIFAHLTVLGIEVLGDGGYLFGLAVTVAASCATLLLLTRHQWWPVMQRVLAENRATKSY